MRKVVFIPADLRIFDGAGTAGSADTGTPASSQQGTQGEPVVMYGKGDEQSLPTESQSQSSNAQELTPEQRAEQWKQIREQYKDEFTNDFQNHFDRRFKDHKTIESRVKQVDPIVETMMRYHGVSTIEELQAVVEKEMLQDIAEAEGFTSVDKYKEHHEAKKKAQLYDQGKQTEAEKAQEEADAQELVERWVKEGVTFKQTKADFDLTVELENPLFVAKLEAGYSVEDAYYLAHRDEQMSEVGRKAAENTIQSIRTGAQRIPENTVQGTPGVVRKTDPSKFTDKDIEEIRRRVRAGEKIKL